MRYLTEYRLFESNDISDFALMVKDIFLDLEDDGYIISLEEKSTSIYYLGIKAPLNPSNSTYFYLNNISPLLNRTSDILGKNLLKISLATSAKNDYWIPYKKDEDINPKTWVYGVIIKFIDIELQESDPINDDWDISESKSFGEIKEDVLDIMTDSKDLGLNIYTQYSSELFAILMNAVDNKYPVKFGDVKLNMEHLINYMKSNGYNSFYYKDSISEFNFKKSSTVYNELPSDESYIGSAQIIFNRK